MPLSFLGNVQARLGFSSMQRWLQVLFASSPYPRFAFLNIRFLRNQWLCSEGGNLGSIRNVVHFHQVHWNIDQVSENRGGWRGGVQVLDMKEG